MDVKGIKTGDITQACCIDLQKKIEAIINAKKSRRRPYYLLITIKEGYAGPLAMGNNNELLHGEDTGKKRKRCRTRTMDLSKVRVASQVIQVLEPYQVPSVPLLANILIRVDNKTGEVKRMYALPPDIPILEDGKGMDSKSVIRDSSGMPIVYGAN